MSTICFEVNKLFLEEFKIDNIQRDAQRYIFLLILQKRFSMYLLRWGLENIQSYMTREFNALMFNFWNKTFDYSFLFNFCVNYFWPNYRFWNLEYQMTDFLLTHSVCLIVEFCIFVSHRSLKLKYELKCFFLKNMNFWIISVIYSQGLWWVTA